MISSVQLDEGAGGQMELESALRAFHPHNISFWPTTYFSAAQGLLWLWLGGLCSLFSHIAAIAQVAAQS